jgi:hypothetical protein
MSKLPLHKRISRPLKKVLRGIGNTAGGDNKAGEVVHGILDLLPVPNQPLGKLIKAIFAGEWTKAKDEVHKLLTVRNIVAIILTLLIVFQVITLDQVKEAINIFEEIARLLK